MFLLLPLIPSDFLLRAHCLWHMYYIQPSVICQEWSPVPDAMYLLCTEKGAVMNLAGAAEKMVVGGHEATVNVDLPVLIEAMLRDSHIIFSHYDN